MLWAGSSEPKLLQKVINNIPVAPTPLSDSTNPLAMTAARYSLEMKAFSR